MTAPLPKTEGLTEASFCRGAWRSALHCFEVRPETDRCIDTFLSAAVWMPVRVPAYMPSVSAGIAVLVIDYGRRAPMNPATHA